MTEALHGPLEHVKEVAHFLQICGRRQTRSETLRNDGIAGRRDGAGFLRRCTVSQTMRASARQYITYAALTVDTTGKRNWKNVGRGGLLPCKRQAGREGAA